VSYQNAGESYNRLRRLYNENGVSRQEYENAQAAYEVARANWVSLRDMVEVRAPIAGYVTRLNVGVSDKVESGDALLTISNYDRLEGKLWVSDGDIGLFRVGLTARARWRDRTLSGRVTQVDLAMDSDREAFLVVVRFENPDRLLRSGVTADVEVETYVNEQAVVVRRDEIVTRSSDPAVFVVQNEQAALKSVTPGREQGVFVEIVDGLQPGELQIVEGIELVSDGARVRVMQ
jgi:RND family efflux transporter MFP subunit